MQKGYHREQRVSTMRALPRQLHHGEGPHSPEIAAWMNLQFQHPVLLPEPSSSN